MVNEQQQAHPTSQSSASDEGKRADAEDVAQSQSEGSQHQSNSLTSLDKFCEENPSASQCLIYEE